MSDDNSTSHAIDGAYINGNVSTAGGDFVGRDKIEQLIQITNVFLVAGSQGVEVLASWLAKQQGLDKNALQTIEASPPPAHIERQVEELQAAQNDVTAQGITLTPQAAYKMGMLAVYRGDFESADGYFRQATKDAPDFSDAFEAHAWLLHTWAMGNFVRGDTEKSGQQLEEAQQAATRGDPLDVFALTVRGFIAKGRGQIYQDTGDQDQSKQYFLEARRLFEGVLKLDPQNAQAYLGLGGVSHGLGDLDGAITVFQKALELQPENPMIWHDLAAAYEGKISDDQVDTEKWSLEALTAWKEAYHLAPDVPNFSAEYVLWMGKRVRWYEKKLGK